jgi:hypothetical protein
LDEMKARITKKAEKKPAATKNDKEQPIPAKPKLMIKAKKLPEKKEEQVEKPAPTGLAGGVKIGGGLKSKLTSLKKPPAAIPSTKKEDAVAEVKESANVGDTAPALGEKEEAKPKVNTLKPKVAKPAAKKETAVEKPVETKPTKIIGKPAVVAPKEEAKT